jgi:DNA topoisomerase-3
VAKKTVEALGGLREYAPFAKAIAKNGWIKPNKRIFDNAKVSDHFAIIPTLETPKHLSEAEHKIYDLVVKRFLAIFHPAAEYLVTTRITQVEQHQFKTEGKVLIEPGWLAVYGKEGQEEQGTLVKVDQGERVKTEQVDAVGLVTKPPARYNEATLLSAMEGAGKLVDDEDLRAAMAGKGLGTPATRAAIIEGLIVEKYLVRDGKDLHPTAKAFQLLTLLRGLGVDELTHPELTGDWEYQLAQMERGKLKRDAFMREIAGMTKKIVERAKSYESDTVPGDYATLKTPCPKCGGVVQENYRRFACTSCDFSITKHPASRSFEYEEVEQLLRDRQIGPLQGFRSKMGRPFAAVLKITPEHKLEFDFGNAPGEGDNAEPVDFSALTPLGACPKCKANVFEQPMAYVCEKSVGPNKSCDFRSGKVILQQEIAAEQMRKLLAEGKTDILRNFVSNKTRRKFSAFLVKKADGGIGFEFEPRPAKTAKASAAGAADKAEEPAATYAARPATKSASKTTAAAPIAAAKTTAKPAAKTATRSATKTAAKTAAKSGTKTAANKAAKQATRSTTGKSTGRTR